MTKVQRFLYWLGFGRFQAFRRRVGGRWVHWCPDEYEEHHLGECILRWQHDPDPPFIDQRVHATEDWTLPKALVRRAS